MINFFKALFVLLGCTGIILLKLIIMDNLDMYTMELDPAYKGISDNLGEQVVHSKFYLTYLNLFYS